jgi:hypothetical protein
MAALLANSLLDLANAPEVFVICLGLKQKAEGLCTQVLLAISDGQ